MRVIGMAEVLAAIGVSARTVRSILVHATLIPVFGDVLDDEIGLGERPDVAVRCEGARARPTGPSGHCTRTSSLRLWQCPGGRSRAAPANVETVSVVARSANSCATPEPMTPAPTTPTRGTSRMRPRDGAVQSAGRRSRMRDRDIRTEVNPRPPRIRQDVNGVAIVQWWLPVKNTAVDSWLGSASAPARLGGSGDARGRAGQPVRFEQLFFGDDDQWPMRASRGQRRPSRKSRRRGARRPRSPAPFHGHMNPIDGERRSRCRSCIRSPGACQRRRRRLHGVDARRTGNDAGGDRVVERGDDGARQRAAAGLDEESIHRDAPGGELRDHFPAKSRSAFDDLAVLGALAGDRSRRRRPRRAGAGTGRRPRLRRARSARRVRRGPHALEISGDASAGTNTSSARARRRASTAPASAALLHDESPAARPRARSRSAT